MSSEVLETYTMKSEEEIKEILDRLFVYKNENDEMKYQPEDILTINDVWLLLDYITNLQEKVNQYENPEDMTLFYMWLDVKAKDKMKEMQTTVNNCKQEINKLTAESTEWESKYYDLQEKYNKALEILVDFNMPCEIDDFNLLDTDYCELNCSVDDEQYKKCWNKFIEWRLQGVDKE